MPATDETVGVKEALHEVEAHLSRQGEVGLGFHAFEDGGEAEVFGL